jgi:hypothetical protein
MIIEIAYGRIRTTYIHITIARIVCFRIEDQFKGSRESLVGSGCNDTFSSFRIVPYDFRTSSSIALRSVISSSDPFTVSSDSEPVMSDSARVNSEETDGLRPAVPNGGTVRLCMLSDRRFDEFFQ